MPAPRNIPAKQKPPAGDAAGFTLVELLVVAAIIALMVGLSALAVRGVNSSVVSKAAAQVASGMSLARQTAITKNTSAAFLIANRTGDGFFREDAFRHWAVVYSNRSAGTWTLSKDWEPLPNGAVIIESRGPNGGGEEYDVATSNSMTQSPGEPFTPDSFDEEHDFRVYTTWGAELYGGDAPVPGVIFSPTGTSGKIGETKAIRIAAGSSAGDKVTLTSDKSYYFVETDGTVGRIRLRDPESYR